MTGPLFGRTTLTELSDTYLLRLTTISRSVVAWSDLGHGVQLGHRDQYLAGAVERFAAVRGQEIVEYHDVSQPGRLIAGKDFYLPATLNR